MVIVGINVSSQFLKKSECSLKNPPQISGVVYPYLGHVFTFMVSYTCIGSAPPTPEHDLTVRRSCCRLSFPLYDCHYAQVGGALLLQAMKIPDFIDQLPTTSTINVCVLSQLIWRSSSLASDHEITTGCSRPNELVP